ncbi:hypothetical protein RZN22_08170 [Bacillaceae bacterium S4-13-58]
MSYPWYKVVGPEIIVSQGDIIPECPVTVLKETDEHPFYTVEGGYKPCVVMTQACDLENGKPKVAEITLCPIEPVINFLQSEVEKKYGNNGQVPYEQIGKKKKANVFDELRKGNYPKFYLLDKFRESGFEFGYHIVSLGKTFKVPVNSLNKIVQESKKDRLRLLPPYREHLANAFAFNYYRIGLPIDIKVEDGEIEAL